VQQLEKPLSVPTKTRLELSRAASIYILSFDKIQVACPAKRDNADRAELPQEGACNNETEASKQAKATLYHVS